MKPSKNEQNRFTPYLIIGYIGLVIALVGKYLPQELKGLIQSIPPQGFGLSFMQIWIVLTLLIVWKMFWMMKTVEIFKSKNS